MVASVAIRHPQRLGVARAVRWQHQHLPDKTCVKQPHKQLKWLSSIAGQNLEIVYSMLHLSAIYPTISMESAFVLESDSIAAPVQIRKYTRRRRLETQIWPRRRDTDGMNESFVNDINLTQFWQQQEQLELFQLWRNSTRRPDLSIPGCPELENSIVMPPWRK